ncbi:hypothetical protein EDD29_0598 [Actinocorallia herbida]|uniref:Uncharacterized protein n=1 Tax=Actinocorallia herbida TaxID=58109 RepID=A0A3N1CP58_9ACTN|nr:hypothetical protein [Actinocorallia herbida]ROO83107.1 hypothetical protein EDD29_0598 [Actinocorallia herbida]
MPDPQIFDATPEDEAVELQEDAREDELEQEEPVPMEADPADTHEQRKEVGIDEDEYRSG